MPYLIDFSSASSEQLVKAMGQRMEQIRLARNYTQEWLASQAGVSVRTIRNLEKGESVSLDTFFRVLIVLGVQRNLETLLPDPSIRPVERVSKRGTERRRASSQGKFVSGSKTWKWGDEGVDHE